MKHIDPKNKILDRLQDSRFALRLTDDTFRYYFQLLLVTSVLGTVAVVMTVMNVLTHKTMLMIATGSFALISYINAGLLLRMRKIGKLNYIMFAVSTVVLFTYFLLTGGTAGFSPHWILLLPAGGMILLGMKRGLIISGIMLVITSFLLWIPAGKSLLMYAYTPEFCMRFPVVYIAFFAIGFSFEIIRQVTHYELTKTRDKLTQLTEMDYLTKIHNRHWFNQRIEKLYANRVAARDGVIMLIDIDNFKGVNDTYGHEIGDVTLIKVAQTINENITGNDMLCRWGGEEFLIYLPDCDVASRATASDCIHECIRRIVIQTEDGTEFHITVSIGAVPIKKGTLFNADRLFVAADEALYLAKNKGKNRTEYVLKS